MRLKPELAGPLIDRGNMHRESGSLEEAIEDLDSAIARMSVVGVRARAVGGGDGHFYRAVARCAREEWGEAKSDFETARQEGVLVASSFCAILGGVAGFEADHGVRMPSDLATMLHTTDPRTQCAGPATTRVRRNSSRRRRCSSLTVGPRPSRWSSRFTPAATATLPFRLAAAPTMTRRRSGSGRCSPGRSSWPRSRPSRSAAAANGHDCEAAGTRSGYGHVRGLPSRVLESPEANAAELSAAAASCPALSPPSLPAPRPSPCGSRRGAR